MLESTDKIVTLNGAPSRIWQGYTNNGVPFHAYITLVAVDVHEDREAFERELMATVAPRPELEAIPARMLL
jgi:hypothetical protein